MVPSPSVREVPLPRPLLGAASMLPVEAGRRERDHRATAPGGEVERKSDAPPIIRNARGGDGTVPYHERQRRRVSRITEAHSWYSYEVSAEANLQALTR